MKKLFSVIAVNFLFCSLSGQNWSGLTARFDSLYRKRNFEEALVTGKQAITVARETYGVADSNYATSLHKLGNVYYFTGQYEKAQAMYLEAVDIRKKVLGENHLAYASSLNNLGNVVMQLGNLNKAEELYLRARDIRKQVLGENHSDYAASLSNLGGLYERMNQYEKAEFFDIDANRVWKNLVGENHPNYAQSLNNLAMLYKKRGQYEKAEPLNIQVKEIRKKALGENHPDYAQSLNNLAVLYKETGQFEKAEPLYIQANEIYRKIQGENNPDYATGRSNLAALYLSMGQYEKAEPLFIQSMEIRKKTQGENHPNYAASLNNLALLYERMGQFEKAEELYTQSSDIRKKLLGENHPDYASSLNNLAILYLLMHQYGKAEALHIQAGDIRKKVLGENHPDYAQSLNNLAVVYRDMGQLEKAESLYTRAKELWKSTLGENHPDYAQSLNNLAFIYKNLGQYEKAERFYIEANRIRKKVLGENHPDYAVSLLNQSALYSDMGQYEKSEPFILSASRIELQNLKNTFAILSEKEKDNYLHHNTILIEINNSFLYNYRKASSKLYVNNFNMQLFFKSLSLADTKNMLASVRNNSDTSIQTLFSEWQKSRKLLAKQYALPVDLRMQGLDSVEAKAENAEKELTRKSSGFRNQQQALDISCTEVRKRLKTGEVAIEFVRFRLYNKGWSDSTMYAAYILTRNDSVPVFVPLCEERQLQALMDSAGTTATSMVASFYRGLEIKNRNAAPLGKELYRLVWAPLEPYLKGVKKISYSPAGKLYNLAFHALPIDNATILMDKYELQQYSSTRQVALEENQNKKPSGITLFGNASFTMDSLQLVNQKISQPEKENGSTGNYTPQLRGNRDGSWAPLPGTGTEVNKVKELFDKYKIANSTFTQATASEDNLKAMSGHSPQVLHIATHGFFLPQPDKREKNTNIGEENIYSMTDDPLLRSGLILAGGNYAWSGKTPVEGVEDGIATAYEISQLNFSTTELVVLSACETALGDIKGAEGVFGLQRAFKMAGVKKMVVSLWQVPDKETAELMTSFYSYWMNGKTISDAFTLAQAGMRKKYPPFYWAAFILVE